MLHCELFQDCFILITLTDPKYPNLLHSKEPHILCTVWTGPSPLAVCLFENTCILLQKAKTDITTNAD